MFFNLEVNCYLIAIPIELLPSSPLHPLHHLRRRRPHGVNLDEPLEADEPIAIVFSLDHHAGEVVSGGGVAEGVEDGSGLRGVDPVITVGVELVEDALDPLEFDHYLLGTPSSYVSRLSH